MAALHDVEHLLFVLAEDVPAGSFDALPEHVTTCRNYHLSPPGEERAERVWPSFAVLLRDAGITVHLRASMPDTLGEVTVLEATRETVAAVLAGLDDLPDATLVAVALAGGDAYPVRERWGAALGDPGTLLLRTPWTSQAWVSEEVCDHTSLIQLCERWAAAARGREVRLWTSEWRRNVCGDLVRALDLGGADDPVAGPGVRPLPYAPEAELVVEDAGAALRLSNVGADRAVHLLVDDGGGPTGVTVPTSSVHRPRSVSVPVALSDGRYDVTVRGPGFERRLTGDATNPPRGGPAWTTS